MTLFDLPGGEPQPPAEPEPPMGPWASMRRLAVLSEDGLYRYTLARTWTDALPALGWVMLNPSKADAEVDDPTMVRVVNFTHAWGYGAAVVCNLFAWRATKPAELAQAEDPVGRANAAALRALAGMDVICAWGASAPTTWG
jgi:hypothetical protein